MVEKKDKAESTKAKEESEKEVEDTAIVLIQTIRAEHKELLIQKELHLHQIFSQAWFLFLLDLSSFRLQQK